MQLRCPTLRVAVCRYADVIFDSSLHRLLVEIKPVLNYWIGLMLLYVVDSASTTRASTTRIRHYQKGRSKTQTQRPSRT
jgi:hypothetical protein